MRNLEEIRKILAEHKEEIREKYGVVITGIFGSYSRGEQKEAILTFSLNLKSQLVSNSLSSGMNWKGF